MRAPSRPALRWYGGKWKLAGQIIACMPPHRIYVEPFGGAASVLLKKPRCYAEIYNDLDANVVNLFRILRDPERAARLIELLRLTPFSREEFRLSLQPAVEPIERARRLCVLSFMGFGSNAQSGYQTGFRANSNRSGSTPAGDWRNYPDALVQLVERLRGVVIENRDASAVMRTHDGPETLHYLDPPYVMATRWQGDPTARARRGYRHEMTDDDHAALLELATSMRGMVLLSAYPHPLYDSLSGGGGFDGLAPHRDPHPRRWRSQAHRGAVAQSAGLRRARSPAAGGGRPAGDRHAGSRVMRWRLSHRFDPPAAALADRHYTRQSPGSPQFMPPGACIVLLSLCGRAVWGTSWQKPEFTDHAWPGAWVCTIFRNEGAGLSSDLIVEAVAATRWHWAPPPQGLITMVDAEKTRRGRSRRSPPGACFHYAGFAEIGVTAGGLPVLGMAPAAMPEAAAPIRAQLLLHLPPAGVGVSSGGG